MFTGICALRFMLMGNLNLNFGSWRKRTFPRRLRSAIRRNSCIGVLLRILMLGARATHIDLGADRTLRMSNDVTRTQIADVFAGVTRAGAASGAPTGKIPPRPKHLQGR